MLSELMKHVESKDPIQQVIFILIVMCVVLPY